MAENAPSGDAKPVPALKFEKVDKPAIKAPDFRMIYVNSTKMGLSPWDIRLILGQVVEEGGDQLHQDMVTVVMSPQHAKAFSAAVAQTVATYEAQFGEIDLGPITKKLAASKRSKAN